MAVVFGARSITTILATDLLNDKSEAMPQRVARADCPRPSAGKNQERGREYLARWPH